jgi:ketosteroid isomerase-like protein
MDNKTTVENAYEYNARGDLTPFLDMVDPDVHWNEAENTPYS